MTKEEAIKNAYGEYWEKVKDHLTDSNWFKSKEVLGDFANTKISREFSNIEWECMDSYHSVYCYYFRPKSLQSIEDNNGWIKLNGLPNEITNRCSMWIMTKNGIEYLKENEFLPIGYATHYKAIEKPKPPIY